METRKLILMFFIPLFIAANGLLASGPAMESRTNLQTMESISETNSENPQNNDNSVNAKSGEHLLVSIEFNNTGDEPALQPELEYPVKKLGDYIDGSARGENCEIKFSIDNGTNYNVPPIHYIELIDGQQIEKTADPSEYTDIKWIYHGAIEPGKGITLSFEITVDGSGDVKEE